MTSSTAVDSRNIRQVAWLDIPGGGQVRVEGRYAYVGHMKPIATRCAARSASRRSRHG